MLWSELYEKLLALKLVTLTAKIKISKEYLNINAPAIKIQ